MNGMPPRRKRREYEVPPPGIIVKSGTDPRARLRRYGRNFNP
jgi:hypothetical protein